MDNNLDNQPLTSPMPILTLFQIFVKSQKHELINHSQYGFKGCERIKKWVLARLIPEKGQSGKNNYTIY